MDPARSFTRADAVAAGVDSRLLRTSKFRRLFRDVYIASETVDEHTRIRAALAIHPSTAFASHHSAARLYGLPVPAEVFEHVTVLDQHDRHQRLGLKCHVVTHVLTHVLTDEPLVAEHHGVRLSHPYRLFIEMAGRLDLINLVVLGDAMVRVFGFSPAELVKACRESRRYHAKAATRGARYVRGGVDSVMETRLRMLIVLAGLPEPTVNHKLYGPDGRLWWRLDLSYPSLKLAVEYDGRQHAESKKQWGRDIKRREALEDDGWKFLVVTSSGVYDVPLDTLRRVRRQLVVRGQQRVPALRDTWTTYFPGTR